MSAGLIGKILECPDDQRRWAEWYKSVYPRLYYKAFGFSRGDAAAARDLVQEAFARFLDYKAIERVSSDEHAMSFLIRTCRNIAIDRDTHAHRYSQVSLEELESTPSVDEPIEFTLDVERILEVLEPQDRRLIEWAGEGLSVSEIAARLGVTYTAAGVRLHRLRKRLREFHGTM